MTFPVTAAAKDVDAMRFQFGENWSRFLRVLDRERITDAERSLADMLGVRDLRGLSFIDVGSGSGLFSLAAKRLGAARVQSFDYDPSSVACARELKRRFAPDDPAWTIEQGSVLDAAYLKTLGSFDIVYSWGVLHHTGDMWRALANATELVKPGGRLFIAIYNDQGATSGRWLTIKRLYNRGPAVIRATLLLLVAGYFEGRNALGRLIRALTTLTWSRGSRRDRGMSFWYDLKDWVGGYPFEVATPEAIFDFCRARGFALRRLATMGGGHGNNQFVFTRTADSLPGPSEPA